MINCQHFSRFRPDSNRSIPEKVAFSSSVIPFQAAAIAVPDTLQQLHRMPPFTLFSVTSPGPDCVIDQVSGAPINLSPRALLLFAAVRLRVERVGTLCGSCAPTKLQCLEVSLFHRGLRHICLLHRMPCSGMGSGSGSNAGAT